jgi:methionine-rich copper-binding protein CopC
MKVIAAAAALLALAALPVIVLGHAQLVSADPPVGGTLTSTPHTLTATFDDELTPNGSSIVVEDAAGAQVATGSVSEDDAHTMLAQLPALANGPYTVKWTAVSADDAAVERGTYAFTVGSTVSTPGTTAAPTPGGGTGGAAGSGGDVLIALGLAAAIVVVVVVFIFVRSRR